MSVFLITGGCGFIGSEFLRRMTDKYPSDFFICFDALTYAGHRINIRELFLKKNFIFIKGDIRNKEEVEKVFTDYPIDYVVNFAAESHVDRSLIKPDDFLTTNIFGTHVLLEASKRHNIRRFHQVSTDEVYGDLSYDDRRKFKEDSPRNPSSPYSVSKASADRMVLAYHRTFSLPVTISRCSNNYGPYQFPEKLIPLTIEKALHNENIPVYGTGENIRDWIYVSDHCKGIDLILRKGHDGEIYNLSGGNEKANLEIVKRILSYLGKRENLIRFVEDRLGHDRRYSLDCSKAEKELGFHPVMDFEKGRSKTIEWYLASQAWIREVTMENSISCPEKAKSIK